MPHSSLLLRQKLTRLSLIAAVPLSLTFLILWAGGWLTPQRLSADKLIVTLEQSGGKHPATVVTMPKGYVWWAILFPVATPARFPTQRFSLRG